jgi:hypothetical protein
MMVHWKEILVEEIPHRSCSSGGTDSFLLEETEASQTFDEIFSENATDEWPSTHNRTEPEWGSEWPNDFSDSGYEFGSETSDDLVPTMLSESFNNSFNISNLGSSNNKNNNSSNSNSINISSSEISISLNSIMNINNNNSMNDKKKWSRDNELTNELLAEELPCRRPNPTPSWQNLNRTLQSSICRDR